MHVEATYTWSDDNSLTLSIKATTDAPTIINLTNHTYWNLDGEDSGSILDHVLKLNASRWLATRPRGGHPDGLPHRKAHRPRHQG